MAQLVHTARQMFETRIAKYNDPHNLEWDWDDLATVDKWQWHAFSAFMDLVAVEKERDALMEVVRDINAWIEFALSGEQIKHRAGRVPPTFTDGYNYVEIPEWQIRQKMASTRMAIEGITEEDIAETRNPESRPT